VSERCEKRTVLCALTLNLLFQIVIFIILVCFRDQHILCVCVCVSVCLFVCSAVCLLPCLSHGVCLCVGSPYKLLKESTDNDDEGGKNIVPKTPFI